MNEQNNSGFQQPQGEPGSPYRDKHSTGFTVASLVLGILSVATSCCIYSALPFGALAILFALLSRGGERKLNERALAGLCLGIAGLVIAITAFVFMFIFTVNSYGGFDAFMQYTNELAEQIMQMQ